MSVHVLGSFIIYRFGQGTLVPWFIIIQGRRHALGHGGVLKFVKTIQLDFTNFRDANI